MTALLILKTLKKITLCHPQKFFIENYCRNNINNVKTALYKNGGRAGFLQKKVVHWSLAVKNDIITLSHAT